MLDFGFALRYKASGFCNNSKILGFAIWCIWLATRVGYNWFVLNGINFSQLWFYVHFLVNICKEKDSLVTKHHCWQDLLYTLHSIFHCLPWESYEHISSNQVNQVIFFWKWIEKEKEKEKVLLGSTRLKSHKLLGSLKTLIIA